MVNYIIRRLFYMVPTLVIISILAFIVIQAPPGDFLTSYIAQLESAGEEVTAQQVERLKARYGLERPMHIRYWQWITGIVLRGDFGQSFVWNAPISRLLASRLPATIMISALTIIFQYSVAIPIGLLSAVKQHKWQDYVFTFWAFIGVSIPNFILALVIMYFMFANFGTSIGGLSSPEFEGASWSLAKAMDTLQHLIVPIIVIGTAGTAGLVRTMRATMLDEFSRDYVRTARAKGISEWRVILKHPTRVALNPIFSTIGWLLPQVISGETIVSIVLNLPTMGPMIFQALRTQDVYLAGSFLLIISVLTVIGTLISDIVLAMSDPRITYS